MTRIDAKTHIWTDVELMAVRAISLIERKMQPKCSNCGVGANRPNCAMDMGGYCPRHEQEDVNAFMQVIHELEKASGLNNIWGWRAYYPLDQIHSLSDDNKSLMHDLYDLHKRGEKHTTRSYDERFNYLSSIHVVSLSAQHDRWFVTFSRRGLEWAQRLFADDSDN